MAGPPAEGANSRHYAVRGGARPQLITPIGELAELYPHDRLWCSEEDEVISLILDSAGLNDTPVPDALWLEIGTHCDLIGQNETAR